MITLNKDLIQDNTSCQLIQTVKNVQSILFKTIILGLALKITVSNFIFI